MDVFHFICPLSQVFKVRVQKTVLLPQVQFIDFPVVLQKHIFMVFLGPENLLVSTAKVH